MNMLGFFIRIFSKVNIDVSVGESVCESREGRRNLQLHEVIDSYSKNRLARLTEINKIKNTGNLSPAETLRRYRTAADPTVFCFGTTPRRIKFTNIFKIPDVKEAESNRTGRSTRRGEMKGGLIGRRKVSVRFKDTVTVCRG